MRYVRFAFIVFSLFFFSACGDGFATAPELNAKVFEALKAQDLALLIKLVPNNEDVKTAAKLYEGGKYTKEEWEQLAESKREAILLKLEIDFKKLNNDLQKKGFDIQHAVLTDTKYQGSKTTDNYDVSSVELMLKSGENQCVIVYNAFTIKGHWYLDKGMELKNILN